jgi:hypothetical protein
VPSPAAGIITTTFIAGCKYTSGQPRVQMPAERFYLCGVIPKARVFTSGPRDLPLNRPRASAKPHHRYPRIVRNQSSVISQKISPNGKAQLEARARWVFVTLMRYGAAGRRDRNCSSFLSGRGISLLSRRHRVHCARHDFPGCEGALYVRARACRTAKRFPRRRRMELGRLGTSPSSQLGSLVGAGAIAAGSRRGRAGSVSRRDRSELAARLVWRADDGESRSRVVPGSIPRRDRGLQSNVARTCEKLSASPSPSLFPPRVC